MGCNINMYLDLHATANKSSSKTVENIYKIFGKVKAYFDSTLQNVQKCRPYTLVRRCHMTGRLIAPQTEFTDQLDIMDSLISNNLDCHIIIGGDLM